MKPSDLVAVVRIGNQAFLETARLTWLMGRRFVQWMRDRREALFVAETEEGEVVGFVFGQCEGEKATIAWIAVHPNHFGRGIGGRLLAAVEDRAREQGIRLMETGTPFARSFYEKHGYICFAVRRAMLLELVGREISLPAGVRVRPLLLDDLTRLLHYVGDENEWLRFVEAYFAACEHEASKAILVTSGEEEQRVVGLAIGQTDSTYGELVTLSYLFVGEEGRTSDILGALAYVSSCRGHRWLGVELPVRGITEEQLASEGWRDAQLPSFWTMYRMRKELSKEDPYVHAHSG